MGQCQSTPPGKSRGVFYYGNRNGDGGRESPVRRLSHRFSVIFEKIKGPRPGSGGAWVEHRESRSAGSGSGGGGGGAGNAVDKG